MERIPVSPFFSVEIHLCTDMKKEEIEKSMKDLKDIIHRMNVNMIDLINVSASAELKLRNENASKDDMLEIERKINELIKKYSLLTK